MVLEVEFPAIELLMALNGYEGKVFHFNGNKNSFEIASNSLTKWLLHPSEVELMKQFLELASDHRYLCDIISSRVQVICPYRVHLIDGIKQCLLTYHKDLNDLQHDVLESKHKVPVSRFLPILRFQPMISRTKELLLGLESGLLTTNEVISDVYLNASSASASDTRVGFQCMMSSMQKILIEDIWSWMMFGYIPKASVNIFFIREQENGFQLIDVPTFLEENGLCDKILFVGSLVHYFSSFQSKPKIFESHIDDFFRQMVVLKNSNTSFKEDLRLFVETVRSAAAKYSSEYVLHEENFVTHLTQMKDVFFTSNEKLWQFFVERIQHAPLDNSWSEQKKNRVLRSLLESILLKLYFSQDQVDSTLRPFKFSFSMRESSILPFISIEYELPSLSKKIIHSKMLTTYQRVFNFLLDLYVARQELSSSWKANSRLRGEVICRKTCFLRHKLLFLVEHIYFYLKINVIEMNFQDLIKEIQLCRDYEEMQLKHAEFVHKLAREAFMTYSNIERILLRMFSICHELFGSVQHSLKTVDEYDMELKNLFKELSILLSALKDLRFYSCLSQLLLQFSW